MDPPRHDEEQAALEERRDSKECAAHRLPPRAHEDKSSQRHVERQQTSPGIQSLRGAQERRVHQEQAQESGCRRQRLAEDPLHAAEEDRQAGQVDQAPEESEEAQSGAALRPAPAAPGAPQEKQPQTSKHDAEELKQPAALHG